MSGKKGMKDYPARIKLEAVRLFLEEGKTKREILELMGIKNKTQIEVWVRKYQEYGPEILKANKQISLQSKLGRPRKEDSSHNRYVERLEMENALLKKFRSELREVRLAQRNIGRSTTTGKNTK